MPVVTVGGGWISVNLKKKKMLISPPRLCSKHQKFWFVEIIHNVKPKNVSKGRKNTQNKVYLSFKFIVCLWCLKYRSEEITAFGTLDNFRYFYRNTTSIYVCVFLRHTLIYVHMYINGGVNFITYQYCLTT